MRLVAAATASRARKGSSGERAGSEAEAAAARLAGVEAKEAPGREAPADCRQESCTPAQPHWLMAQRRERL